MARLDSEFPKQESWGGSSSAASRQVRGLPRVQVIVFPSRGRSIMSSRSTEMTRPQQSATTPRSQTLAPQTLTLRSIYRRLFATAVIGVSSSNRSRSSLLAAICSMESSKESAVETVGAPCFNVHEGILMVASRSEV